MADEGTMMLIAPTFALHCGKCGMYWSIPQGTPNFVQEQAALVEMFTKHACDPVTNAIAGEALSRARLAMTALDLGSTAECGLILSRLVEMLVQNGAIDPLYEDEDQHDG